MATGLNFFNDIHPIAVSEPLRWRRIAGDPNHASASHRFLFVAHRLREHLT